MKLILATSLNTGAVIYWLIIEHFLSDAGRSGTLIPYLLPGLIATIASVILLLYAIAVRNGDVILVNTFNPGGVVAVTAAINGVIYCVNWIAFKDVLILGF